MTENGTTATHQGPVAPPTPDVSALAGGRRRRASRIAAATQRSRSAASAEQQAPQQDGPEVKPEEETQSQGSSGQQPQPGDEVGQATEEAKPASDVTSEEAPADLVHQPAEETGGGEDEPGSSKTLDGTEVEVLDRSGNSEPLAVSHGVDAPAPSTERTEAGTGQTKEATPASQAGARATADAADPEPDETSAGPDQDASGLDDTSEPRLGAAAPHVEEATDEDGVDEDEDEDDQDDEAEFVGGKHTLQAYVPDSVATKFQQMQQTGHTAEVIVLTAVRNAAERIPQLIEEARGPVHKEGLFPGLEILEKKPGRKTKERPNSSRVQYQVRTQFLPDLLKVARRHNLKLSVLVRLALGDFFKEPVRMGRTKR